MLRRGVQSAVGGHAVATRARCPCGHTVRETRKISWKHAPFSEGWHAHAGDGERRRLSDNV
eukprot:3127322-Lingulodinium_polyedra.AAC.1